MKTYGIIKVLFYYFLLNSCLVSCKKREKKPIPAVDALISSLQQEQWGDDERCLQATLNWLSALQNNTLWAAWMWDSMQPPVGTFYSSKGHLGNFDQCIKFPWSVSYPELRPQYCLVHFKVPLKNETRELSAFEDAQKFYEVIGKHHQYNHEHFVGVCLPSSCSEAGVWRVFRHIIQQTSFFPEDDMTAVQLNCQSADQLNEFSRNFYVFWYIIGALVSISIISTYYSNAYDTQRSSFTSKIIHSFCIRRNFRSLFTVNKDNIVIMPALRFFTAAILIPVHIMFYLLLFPLINKPDIVESVATSTTGKIWMQIVLVLETFFTMSGLLLMRSLMTGDKKLLIVLIKRYFRLIGPLAIIVLFISTALHDSGSGPCWIKAIATETEICKNYWWRNLLMISNLNLETLCYVVSWYVANDYQLSVMVVFLFYLYKKNSKAGVVTAAVVFVSLSLYHGFKAYELRLPYIPLYDTMFNLDKIMRDDKIMPGYHFSVYCHSGSYFVGVILGYFMAKYRPQNYRNVISEKTSTLLVASSIITMGLVLSYGALLHGNPYSPVLCGVLVILNRIGWGAAISGLIIASEYGSMPSVMKFLGWSGFVPLSKLCYCIYLIHPLVIILNYMAGRTPGQFSNIVQLIQTYGVFVITCILSLIVYIIAEAPVINISNVLFNEKKTVHPASNSDRTSGQSGAFTDKDNDIMKSKTN